MPDAGHLQRRIGLPLLTFYGLGVMVGAGIYVLVGAVAGQVGTATWLVFVLAGLLAAPSALSFAELSARMPEAAGEVAYLTAAFGRAQLAQAVGFAIVLAGTFSAAAVLRGGVGYLVVLLPVPMWLGIAALGVVLVGVAILGVVESLAFAAILTVIELVGLAGVILAGFLAPPIAATMSEISVGTGPVGAGALLAASALAFFAFIGFEDMVNLAEEVRNPERTMPRAILIALASVAVLYALVGFVATRAVSPGDLSASGQPLALVWSAGFGGTGAPLAAIAVVAALNGVLAQIVMAARVLFGMGRAGGRLAPFHRAHRRFGTPVLGTTLVGLAVILSALLLPVGHLAEASATVLLCVFTLINAALIVLKRKAPDAPFRIPGAIPWIGMVASLLALAFSLFSVA